MADVAWRNIGIFITSSNMSVRESCEAFSVPTKCFFGIMILLGLVSSKSITYSRTDLRTESVCDFHD